MAYKRATLTLKLGDREVRYEADREAVEAKLDHVLDRLLRDAPAGVQVGFTPPQPQATVHPPPGPRQAGAPPAAAPTTDKPDALPEARRLAQLYRLDDKKRLRLRKLPGRTADTLLLVLYGLRKLQGKTSVHAPGMNNAARASGARIDRADRLLAGYEDLVEGFGKRRGKRYRLTAAGRRHCARLVEELVGPIAQDDDGQKGSGRPAAVPQPAVAEPKPSAADQDPDPNVVPAKVTKRWDGEVLTLAETARRLGVTEAEVAKLRRDFKLLGLPGGNRRRRLYFYPAFQIDADRHRIDPQVQEVNQRLFRSQNSWSVASWWSEEDFRLGRKPVDLIGTPEADAVVRAAEARFSTPD